MKPDKELINILNDCLERMLVSGETIEQCLANYPEYAAEIEPLLRTAAAIGRASAIEPRPEFRSRARYEFQSALQEARPQRKLPIISGQPRWAIALVTVLIVLLGAGGTVIAAGDSMPDSFLYPVKLATEEVRLKLTVSNLGKAELYAEIADKRVSEIVYMVNKGEYERVEDIGERLSGSLVAMANVTSAEAGVRVFSEAEPAAPAPAAAPDTLEKADAGANERRADEKTDLRKTIEGYLINHPAALDAALQNAPESVKPVLQKIIAELTSDYEQVLQTLK